MFASTRPECIIASGSERANSITFNYSNKQTASIHNKLHEHLPHHQPRRLILSFSSLLGSKRFVEAQVTVAVFPPSLSPAN
ncbi:hypothetical protein GOODEAATRI_019048 [Goodea atripinnis]|uniref:Uncharacterized protein n=1 Tax=Goodea atripinnis TaxID=208336 RepID=A0ABV0PPV1_9TELE